MCLGIVELTKNDKEITNYRNYLSQIIVVFAKHNNNKIN